MRVLLTGANGYIGLRLLPSLLEEGHQVIAVVRSLSRFPREDFLQWQEEGQIEYVEADVLDKDSLPSLQVDAAYYFLHSMGGGQGFVEREAQCAQNFKEWMSVSECKQVVYLGGLSSGGGHSEHMSSRRMVADILEEGSYALTVLRASIIVGSGSASFEIIRDLAEKLPVMVTPKWTQTRCQPIGVGNVMHYLEQVLANEDCYGKRFDIGGPEVLTYENLLKLYAKIRGLNRICLPVPLLSPKLSSRWLQFITATSYSLAQSLVASLHIESVCESNEIHALIPQDLLTYEEAIEKALSLIAQNRVPSVWYDSLASGSFNRRNLPSLHVPEHGVLTDSQDAKIVASREEVINSVWSIGGEKGWPSLDWAWKVRGWIDQLVGGIGIRRGRRHPQELRSGDALDFWRVLLADREAGRLILYAEMKLPGEAWLEFHVQDGFLRQTATFRPKGLVGRAYWLATYPFHLILFPRMIHKLVRRW